MKFPNLFTAESIDTGDVRVSAIEDCGTGEVVIDLWCPFLPHPTDPTGHARLTVAQASNLGRLLRDFAAANRR